VTHIVCFAEHDLGRTIPPIHDVIGHEPRRQLRVDELAREPKIANLELAVLVHEQVSRLEVAMHRTSRMDVFQTAESLVDERLEVRVRKGLAGTDLEVKVGAFSVRSSVHRDQLRKGRQINRSTHDGLEVCQHEF